MSFQSWTEGDHLISSIDYQNYTYNLVASQRLVFGETVGSIWLYLYKGVYQVNTPDVVCFIKIPYVADADPYEFASEKDRKSVV